MAPCYCADNRAESGGILGGVTEPAPLAILTSGGDAPGMNAAIRAIAKVAASQGVPVMGVTDGYTGLIEGRLRPLTVQDPAT
ncbi:MAG: 6-phosphofructokinase, partial [Deltaproteobacteria bacterium]|nr:6-phosphofructokinase [Deltaproteobacteria bacterium]